LPTAADATGDGYEIKEISVHRRDVFIAHFLIPFFSVIDVSFKSGLAIRSGASSKTISVRGSDRFMFMGERRMQ
jgi:hypothetical protein